MKRMMTIAIASIFCAGQVSALSCLRPDAARGFKWAAQAEEDYIILMGQFLFTPPPNRDPIDNDAQPVSLQAQFQGSYLGASGFVEAPALDLIVTFTCAGPWCDSMNSGPEDVLAFVQQTPSGYTLAVGPCQDNVFSADVAPQVEACMRGEACEESDPLR